MRLDAWNVAGEMNETTRKSRSEELASSDFASPSISDPGMELGLNSWLPAYGFHASQLQLQLQAAPHHLSNFQPVSSQDDTRSSDALLVQQVEFLETIFEETSDDLQSDSDRSGTTYWVGSDSETESVIHIRSRYADEKVDGSESDCNSVVPKKRRRKNGLRDDEESSRSRMFGDNDEDSSGSSRSSSLLQFESLERNCATHNRDSPSNYSFDSLDFAHRGVSTVGNPSPDSLESRSTDHEEISASSRPPRPSTNGFAKIRPYRSFESLDSCQIRDDGNGNGNWNGNGGGLGLGLSICTMEKSLYEAIEAPRLTIGNYRLDLSQNSDFWNRSATYDDEEHDGDEEYEDDDFDTFLGFDDDQNSLAECRNVIDLREIGIEPKRDLVSELRSGQASSALIHSRLNIAGNAGCGGDSGQQGWSESSFNFRFTDKSQSAPSLASDARRLSSPASSRRHTLPPEYLRFGSSSQDFQDFYRVSSVPSGLNLCEVAAPADGVADSATYSSEMAEPRPPGEGRKQPKSTVRTQDRTEMNVLVVPVPVDSQDVEGIVDEAVRQFERDGATVGLQERHRVPASRPRRVKNNASYELAQQFEVGARPARNWATSSGENGPQPPRRHRVKNNASYELAQQYDYVHAIAGASPSRAFQRMDACDELEEPANSSASGSQLKVTDLVEEMDRTYTAGTASVNDLTSLQARQEDRDSRVYSRSSEDVRRDSTVNGSTVVSRIKKNSDIFLTSGESGSDESTENVVADSPQYEPLDDHHQHPVQQRTPSPESPRPTAFPNDPEEKSEQPHLNPDEAHGSRLKLKVNVNLQEFLESPITGSSTSASNIFSEEKASSKASTRSHGSTPNLRGMSLLGELYPEQNFEAGCYQDSGDPFADDVDEGIGSVKDYDRSFFRGSVRSESAIGCRKRASNGHHEEERGTTRIPMTRSGAGSSTTSGNTSLLGDGSTSSEWASPRPESGADFPLPLSLPLSPLSTPLQRQSGDSLQRNSSFKRAGTVEAKQTGVPPVVSSQPIGSSVSGSVNVVANSAPVMSGKSVTSGEVLQPSVPVSRTTEKKKGLGGFLQRFSKLRFSGRSKVPRSEVVKKGGDARSVHAPNPGKVINNKNNAPDYVIIPLHGPITNQENLRTQEPKESSTNLERTGSNISSNSRSASISSKPPLPPQQPPRAGALTVGRSSGGAGTRRRAATDLGSSSGIEMAKARAMQAGFERPVGLLETDLDAAEVGDVSSHGTRQVGVATTTNGPSNKKTRSLLNLNQNRAGTGVGVGVGLGNALRAPESPGGNGEQEGDVVGPHQRPHKSMEFLLDKENLHFVAPPENELQKVGERVPSEHELRVQRSLQRLNVPDWYKNSPAARDGFRLKRHSDASQHGGGWRALGSKTTSLSSLSSPNKPTIGPLLSPSPTPPVFSRWSTSLLNSAGSSPASSARSSFNHRQPYLGWRSQERLSNPRTPAERLAQGILPTVPPTAKTTNFGPAQQLEVRNSIKEVTSAIVHYVQSGQETNHGGRLSPRPDDWDERGSARSTSPRGSVKLCWMESSFVGSRPVDSPETPMSLTTDADCCVVCNSTATESCTCVDSAASGLFLDLTPDGGQHMSRSLSSHCQRCPRRGSGSVHSETEEAMAAAALLRNKPSPGSTTLEDVLDSLLGLPPASRTPSPGPGPTRRSNAAGKSCSTLRQDLQESANGANATDTSNHVGEDSSFPGCGLTRRKSEGSDTIPVRSAKSSSSSRNRRVSFDNAQESTSTVTLLHQEKTVRCRYGKCGAAATPAEARRTFKSCHNCSYTYCSRECRRAHWERHRRTCLHSRAGTLCRQVLSSAKEDNATLRHVSTLAQRGYASHGRGAVKCFFASPEAAEKFVNNGFVDLGEPTYARWSDLLPSEMGTELYSELMRLCKSYNPDTRLVLYVAVCVVSEVPTTGAVRWERQLVSRCAKIRLAGTSRESSAPTAAPSATRPSASPCNITREMDSPETLVLTSFPGSNGQNTPQRAREISFTNIQRQLRLRGVSLRRHFPQVYKKLCSYVDGSVDKFAPVTIYPRDHASGKSFMCIIMLDAEPERLQLLPTDSSRVRTVDISIEQE